jgi:8-amino-7-oxononanoate synthase
MTLREWSEWAQRETDAIHESGRWRAPRSFDASGPEGTLTESGESVISFASNDYLGLTQHPDVINAAHTALDRWGAGSGSARLIVGSRPVHEELEEALAQWRNTERAVLFPTGFAANLGVFGALASKGTLICSDELNHASIIDGTRLSPADVSIFPHKDLSALGKFLAERGERRAIVVSDTVFSMDGDIADVDDLRAICHEHSALLVLDEAHAALGPQISAERDDEIIRVGTLSKAVGVVGGFVAGPRIFTDLLINRARSYIFTTAPSPADTAAAVASIGIIQSSEGDKLRAALRRNIEILRPGHPSPIIPIMCGTESRALEASAALLKRGMLVPAIRPPTVAPGTSRLRVALSASHTTKHVESLRDALIELGLS